MARFTDVLAEIAEAGGGYPEDFTARITEAYDEDITALNNQISERDETVNVLNETIADLKGRNATLIQSVPADNPNEFSGNGDDVDEPETKTVDDLFPSN